MSGALLALPGQAALASGLRAALDVPAISLAVHEFPDGESYVRIGDDVSGRSVAVLCTLHEPNPRFLPLAFIADTLRELGAVNVGLVAPYLAYMRQDARFKPGEAITSASFARLVSRQFDWLVTVDPHLHRWHALADIYTIPAVALQAAPLLAAWIRLNLTDAVLIGPDEESAQWVSAVAAAAGCPWLVLKKQRRGDRDVSVSSLPEGELSGRTPVLVDDIISSGQTMAQAVRQCRSAGAAPPVCMGVHGVFAPDALVALQQAGAGRVVTTNSIAHPSNEMDLSPLLAGAVTRFWQSQMQLPILGK
jgi:ribose-phosphate pyrophosphokinase